MKTITTLKLADSLGPGYHATLETETETDVVFLSISTPESSVDVELTIDYCTELITALEKAKEDL